MTNITLWMMQGMLALIFTAASLAKLSQPLEKIEQKIKLPPGIRPQHVRLLGLAELIGVLGLILPRATGIFPFLTPIASLCLAVIMIGAIYVNIRTKQSFALSAVTFFLCIMVTWGRWL